jgi:hypothetical protein
MNLAWLTEIWRDFNARVYVKGSNPGACRSFPDCAPMCVACDIKRFNIFEETGVDPGESYPYPGEPQ